MAWDQAGLSSESSWHSCCHQRTVPMRVANSMSHGQKSSSTLPISYCTGSSNMSVPRLTLKLYWICINSVTTLTMKLVGWAGSGIPMQRGASLTTSEHIDPASPPPQLADMEDPEDADIPEGAVRFNVTAEDIASAIAEESLEVLCALACHHLQGSSSFCFNPKYAARACSMGDHDCENTAFCNSVFARYENLPVQSSL